MAMPQRTQAERSDATTAKLVAAASELFGRDGYTATTIEAVAASAGMTKGAAYHHFRSKAALFREVFIREQREVSTVVTTAALTEPDPWSGLLRGFRTFLEHCLDPAFRQIVLLDAPAVLGWETVREIERDHVLHVLHEGLRAAAGYLTEGDLAIRSQLLFGALCEAGMLLARAPAPQTTLPVVITEANRLLGALKVR
jgi:AcrR family transcriptional regulator